MRVHPLEGSIGHDQLSSIRWVGVAITAMTNSEQGRSRTISIAAIHRLTRSRLETFSDCTTVRCVSCNPLCYAEHYDKSNQRHAQTHEGQGWAP